MKHARNNAFAEVGYTRENSREHIASNASLRADSELESGQSRLEEIPGDLLSDLLYGLFGAVYGGLRFVSVDG